MRSIYRHTKSRPQWSPNDWQREFTIAIDKFEMQSARARDVVTEPICTASIDAHGHVKVVYRALRLWCLKSDQRAKCPAA